MPEQRLSISQLLDLPAQGLGREMLRAGMKDDARTSFQKQIAAALPEVPLASVEAAVGRRLSDTLNIDPMKLFVEAWQKENLLTAAAERSKSGDPEFLPLLEHPVKSVLRSYVEIVLGPKPMARIDVDVTLSLTLKGLILRLEAGEIRAIEAGSCEGDCEIEVQQESVWKQHIESFSLPGAINLSEGFPIR